MFSWACPPPVLPTVTATELVEAEAEPVVPDPPDAVEPEAAPVEPEADPDVVLLGLPVFKAPE